jgi:hypothetical protein
MGASFIVTGEVLGQRPMSQNKTAMEIIEKESGLEGYIVRPLSANAMKPSIPEEKGWVDRSRFFDITGRSRQHQLELVDEWKITGHACPAGGCLLTDGYFGLKVKDLIKAGMFNLSNAGLFMHGRYFSVSDKFKLAVARNEEEGKTLKKLVRKDDFVFEPADRGPFAVGRGEADAKGVQDALKIVSFYCKENKPGINFSVYPEKDLQLTEVQKPEEKFVLAFRLV